MSNGLELAACQLKPVKEEHFNPLAVLPYGVTIEHIQYALNDFLDFLCFINTQLYSRESPRLETLLMAANFSSVVGEYMHYSIPRYCSSVVKNRWFNGHPDLIPAGRYVDNKVQHGEEGIEIKASRYTGGWQGHNPEDTWLMVFVYDSNRPSNELSKPEPPRPFRFLGVFGAALLRKDWSFSGRSGTSRRTITASVLKSGRTKMLNNWIYRLPS